MKQRVNTRKRKKGKMTDIIEHCNNHQDNLSSLKSSSNQRYSQFQRSPTPHHMSVDEVDNRDYRLEEHRLQSFANWPVPYMDPAKLAAAGFYYTGEGDKVRCFECKVEICEWVEGDNPMADHQRWQEECRFIRKIPCGNVPIGESPNSVPLPRPRSRDVCGPYGIEYRPNASPDCHSAPTEFQLPSTARLGSLGLGRAKGPAYPEYASYDARLRTFESWPKSMPQTKESLADAGFYYTGKGDQTLCYHCGGGLKDWEPNDDPWEQHAKWFSKCCYLLIGKGQAYVNTVTGQSMAPPSKEETMQMNLPSCVKTVETTCAAGPSSRGSSTEATKPETQEIAKPSTTVTNATPSVNKTVDDARMCKICYGEELGVVFLPCGHMVACVKCAPAMTTCALCRQPVSMTVRAFFS